MTPDSIDWRSGEVVYWDLDGLDPSRPLDEQLDELKEDLAQARFGKRTVLDVGWYPEFSAAGTFVVTVIRDEDWDEPLYRRESTSIPALLRSVTEGIAVAER